MNCLTWNRRGLGNSATFHELLKIVKREGLTLLFIMDTKIRGKCVENLKSFICFSGCFSVDSDGPSGGIGLFWSDVVSVEL